MKKFAYTGIGVLLLLALVMSSALSCAPSPKPEVAPQRHTIALYTTPFGTGSYILGQCLEEASRGNPDIHLVSSECPGTTWGMKHMLATPVDWPDTIVNLNRTIQWLAVEGVVKFEKPQPEAFDFRVISLWSILSIHFVTLDPAIKTIYDLDGKDVAVGKKAQVGYNVLPGMVFGEGMGVQPNLKWLGTTPAMDALLDRKVDAAILGLYWAADLKNFEPGPPFTKLEASGKKFYHIDWTKDLKSATEKVLPEGKVLSLVVPANALPNQPEPINVLAHAIGFWAHKTFNEEAAYLTTKLFLDNYKEFYDRHALLALIRPEVMVYGYENDPEVIHPGSLRAYKEAGVMK